VKDGRPQGRDTAGRGSSVHDSLPAHSGSPIEKHQSDVARLSSATVVERKQRKKRLPSSKAATEAVNSLFRPGFKYSKAEVLLMDLRQPSKLTDDLFSNSQPVMADKVMSVLDEINGR
jgi:hypothetical protein